MATAAVPEPVLTLSAGEARRIALRAQGLLGAPDRRGGVPAMLRALGAVQLDTISVLARSHELVSYARLGPVGRDAVEQALWGGDALRVLVARRMRAADDRVAAVRLPPAEVPRAGHALARRAA